MVAVAELEFNESLVAFLDDASDWEQAENQLAGALLKGGYVRAGFAEAIIEREKSFPTALEVGEHNVAIPHCDAEYTISPALCFGVLRNPVAWRRMDDADETCQVSFVIMLALSDPHDHLEVLQRVVSLVQDQELLEEVLKASDAAGVVARVGPRLVGRDG